MHNKGANPLPSINISANLKERSNSNGKTAAGYEDNYYH